jgi:hypothetical protein
MDVANSGDADWRMHVTTRRKLGNEYGNTVLDDRHEQMISHP